MEQTIEPMDVDTCFMTNDIVIESINEAKIYPAIKEKSSIPEVRYENYDKTFTTGIDIFGPEEQLKMKERAKRFGLQDNLEKTHVERDKDLYLSMGIAEENENAKNLRLNVLHMRGTEDMSTKDVFQYFKDYAPASIEWINDVSCNVVWHDKISAARALLRLSMKIVGLDEKVAADRHLKSEASSFDDENKLANDDCIIQVVGDDESTGEGCNNKIDGDGVISLKDIDCPLPPGLWRKGIDYPKSKAILLRFATRGDKKQPNAEKMSDYYKKYGNPNFGGKYKRVKEALHTRPEIFRASFASAETQIKPETVEMPHTLCMAAALRLINAIEPKNHRETVSKDDTRTPVIGSLKRNGQDPHNVTLTDLQNGRNAYRFFRLGIKGLLTESRKRMYKQVRHSKKRSDDKFSDDECDRKGSKNPWGALSKTWGQNDSVEDSFPRAEFTTTEHKGSVKKRLGFKHQPNEPLPSAALPTPSADESNSEADSGSSDEEWCKRSKILRMRMHADDEEEKILKKRIKQRTQELHASILNQSSDLRTRLINTRRPVYRDAIRIVVTSNSEKCRPPRGQLPKANDSEITEPEESDVEEVTEAEEAEEIQVEEPEEGEWVEEVEQIVEENNDSDESDLSEKEVQGPKGSVIKVVPRAKPRVASTVWARLNNKKPNVEWSDRSSSKGHLRETVKGDLKSRLGYQKRGRSPLRIEVKNDKYAEEMSDTE